MCIGLFYRFAGCSLSLSLSFALGTCFALEHIRAGTWFALDHFRAGTWFALEHIRARTWFALEHIRTGTWFALEHIRAGTWFALEHIRAGTWFALEHIRAGTHSRWTNSLSIVRAGTCRARSLRGKKSSPLVGKHGQTSYG